METRLRTHMDALRVLARLNDLNQVILVERNIDEFLQTNADQVEYLPAEPGALEVGAARKRPGGLDGTWSCPRLPQRASVCVLGNNGTLDVHSLVVRL